MIDLTQPGQCKALADRIKSDIDAYCQKAYDDGPRTHLGASLIGHECSRYLWYTFRWFHHEVYSGRMYRLFNRGHREEDRFIEWLRGVGFEVFDRDQDGNQFRITELEKHFGGSMDCQLILPEHYQISETIVLGEFKTSGTGSKFTNLLKNGVKLEKPQHFNQMSMYGYKKNLRYGLYLCINKNDDDLHVEIVPLDWQLGADLVRKAEMIITARTAPNRIAKSATYLACKMCDMKGVCWENAPVAHNCRSCENATPVANGEWYCAQFQANVPKDYIKSGCDRWRQLGG